MVRINVNLYPKDGYVFKDMDGTAHRSPKGWKDLIQRVIVYRRVNRMDPGDPEREVHAQACANNPSYCAESASMPVVATSRASLKSLVMRWLSEMRKVKDKLPFVKPQEAKERAQTCAQCPFNVELKSGCAPCHEFVAEMRKNILQGREIDGRLRACDKLARDAAVLVHIDLPTEKQDDLPAHCWMKRR
jgi:hypothetical protein